MRQRHIEIKYAFDTKIWIITKFKLDIPVAFEEAKWRKICKRFVIKIKTQSTECTEIIRRILC